MFTLGFSPCPNDTFIFYALVNAQVNLRGLQYRHLIDDVQNLNTMTIAGELDISKVSCSTYALIKDTYEFLPVGSAIGRGCGPIIIAKDSFIDRPDNRPLIVASPGKYTTATLLFKIFMKSMPNIRYSIIHMPFNRIAEAVKYDPIDAGLLIHESRFTFHKLGLTQVLDLGQWWEKTTGLPVPLGGICAKKSLGQNTIDKVTETIKDSILYAYSHKAEVMHFIKQYSQEISDDVIENHLNLYVTDYTLDIGSEGKSALEMLLKYSSSIDIHSNGQ